MHYKARTPITKQAVKQMPKMVGKIIKTGIKSIMGRDLKKIERAWRGK